MGSDDDEDLDFDQENQVRMMDVFDDYDDANTLKTQPLFGSVSRQPLQPFQSFWPDDMAANLPKNRFEVEPCRNNAYSGPQFSTYHQPLEDFSKVTEVISDYIF